MIPTFTLGQIGRGRTLTPPVTSYANTYGTGNRPTLTISGNFAFDAGAMSLLADGDTTSLQCDEPGTGSTAVAGSYVQVDFPSLVYIDEVKLYRTQSPTLGGPTTFKYQLLENGLYADVSAAFNIVGAAPIGTTTTPTLLEGTTSLRIIGVSGNWPNHFWAELEFKIAPGAS